MRVGVRESMYVHREGGECVIQLLEPMNPIKRPLAAHLFVQNTFSLMECPTTGVHLSIEEFGQSGREVISYTHWEEKKANESTGLGEKKKKRVEYTN